MVYEYIYTYPMDFEYIYIYPMNYEYDLYLPYGLRLWSTHISTAHCTHIYG